MVTAVYFFLLLKTNPKPLAGLLKNPPKGFYVSALNHAGVVLI